MSALQRVIAHAGQDALRRTRQGGATASKGGESCSTGLS